jgi:hypothetical protein
MFDGYYGQQIYQVLSDIYSLLTSMSQDIKDIFISVVFFGFLMVAFNFVSKRWLTLNA